MRTETRPQFWIGSYTAKSFHDTYPEMELLKTTSEFASPGCEPQKMYDISEGKEGYIGRDFTLYSDGQHQTKVLDQTWQAQSNTCAQVHARLSAEYYNQLVQKGMPTRDQLLAEMERRGIVPPGAGPGIAVASSGSVGNAIPAPAASAPAAVSVPAPVSQSPAAQPSVARRSMSFSNSSARQCLRVALRFSLTQCWTCCQWWSVGVSGRESPRSAYTGQRVAAQRL